MPGSSLLEPGTKKRAPFSGGGRISFPSTTTVLSTKITLNFFSLSIKICYLADIVGLKRIWSKMLPLFNLNFNRQFYLYYLRMGFYIIRLLGIHHKRFLSAIEKPIKHCSFIDPRMASCFHFLYVLILFCIAWSLRKPF
jgi:hypothetical protein